MARSALASTIGIPVELTPTPNKSKSFSSLKVIFIHMNQFILVMQLVSTSFKVKLFTKDLIMYEEN